MPVTAVTLTIPLAPNAIRYATYHLEPEEKPMPNVALLNTVMDHIEAHPEVHNQKMWIDTEHECGTAACFAGWTVLINGNAVVHPESGAVDLSWRGEAVRGDRLFMPVLPELAMRLLGLTLEDAQYMFASDRTREELRAKVDELSTPDVDLDAELESLVDETLLPV